MAPIYYFRIRMERPHQFGFGTWQDVSRAAREIEDTYGVYVFIEELSRGQYLRMTELEDVYFADLRQREWEKAA